MANKKKTLQKQIQSVTEAVRESVDDSELADTMSRDFEELLIHLNDEVEARIEQFRSTSVRVLRDTYQTRPYQIFSVIDEMVEKLYATTTPVGACLSTVMDNCFRREVADCLKDLIDIYQRGVTEKYTKHNSHLGVKAN
jgi:hypothetical protein